jgi:Thiol-disulfide isomerase and thioredoxins
MKPNKTLFTLVFAAMVMFFSASASFAQDTPKTDDAMKKDESMKKDDTMMKDDGMKKDDAMMKDDHRPVVAIIAADWCPYCKRIDPVVKDVMSSYSEKIHFVVFDVTNETTTAAAKEKAEKLGMGNFFDEYKGKTSTVAVLKNNKVVYKTSNNGKKDDYVKALDKALK